MAYTNLQMSPPQAAGRDSRSAASPDALQGQPSFRDSAAAWPSFPFDDDWVDQGTTQERVEKKLLIDAQQHSAHQCHNTSNTRL